MKKNFLKISLAFCFLAILSVSSVNLNASGEGGGGGEEEHDGHNMRLFTVECTTKPGSWSYCDYMIGHTCDVGIQHECRI